MTYNLTFSPGAEKQYALISKTSKSLISRIDKALEKITQNPYSGKMLSGRLSGYYTYRVGTYRIMYTINKNQIIVYILKIEKRGSVYRQILI